jgi:hypothetical protein
MTDDLDRYRSRGARALVILHERNLRAFLPMWREAVAAGVELPPSDHPAYQSLETILGHVLAAARGYMVWICRVLELPDPGIDPTPEDHELDERVDAYLEHLLGRWRIALRDVPEERFEDRSYRSNWGDEFTIDGMLEHAVVHPMRHGFQLEEMIARRRAGG